MIQTLNETNEWMNINVLDRAKTCSSLQVWNPLSSNRTVFVFIQHSAELQHYFLTSTLLARISKLNSSNPKKNIHINPSEVFHTCIYVCFNSLDRALPGCRGHHCCRCINPALFIPFSSRTGEKSEPLIEKPTRKPWILKSLHLQSPPSPGEPVSRVECSFSGPYITEWMVFIYQSRQHVPLYRSRVWPSNMSSGSTYGSVCT